MPRRTNRSRDDSMLLHRAGSGPARLEVRQDADSRWLQFGEGPVQSLMDRAAPHALVLPYTRAMLAGLLFREPPARVLMAGLGGGSLLRFLRHHHPATRFTVIERDAEVVRTAAVWFRVPVQDPALEVVLGDVRSVLPAPGNAVDWIFADVFDAQGMPAWMRGPRMFAACHRRLAAGGVLSLNLWVSGDHEFLDTLGALADAFDGNVLAVPVSGYRNLVALGFRQPPSGAAPQPLEARAQRLQRRYGIEFPELLARIRAANAPALHPASS